MTKPSDEKECPKCKKSKPLAAFMRDYHSPDHRRSRCRACNAKRKIVKGDLWQTKYADQRGATFAKMRYGKKGMSVAEIAKQEGVSRQAIHQSLVRYVHRHGMEHLLGTGIRPHAPVTPTVTQRRELRERRTTYEPLDIPTGSIFRRRS